MREIKFRGKRVDNGEWVYGYYTFEFERDYSSVSYDDVPRRCSYISNENGEYFKVIYETIGQFSELFVGKQKIYEGDIIKFKFKSTNKALPNPIRYGKVAYTKSGLVVEEDSVNVFTLFGILCLASKSVIVGNIHDNPELLKGELK